MTACGWIQDLGAIESDRMIRAAMTRLDAPDAAWPARIETVAQKRLYMRSHLEALLASPIGAAFWAGSPDRVAIFGTVQPDAPDRFDIAIGLVAADPRGSTAYALDPAFIAGWRAWLHSEAYRTVRVILPCRTILDWHGPIEAAAGALGAALLWTEES